MANYKVKSVKQVPNCKHAEDLPPITAFYLGKGGIIHARCQQGLDYRGTSQIVRGIQADFWCNTCNEGVSVPLSVLARIDVVPDDIGWGVSGSTLLRRLRSLGNPVSPVAGVVHDRVPPQVGGKDEKYLPCRLCHLPHYVNPTHPGGSQ